MNQNPSRATPPPLPPEALRKRSTPPPIPENAKRNSGVELKKGPPPIPEDAKRKPPQTGTVMHAEFRTLESREGNTVVTMGAATEAAHTHPDRNEDAYYTSPKRGIQFVADGMGSVPAGDRASAEAASVLKRENLHKLDEATRKVFEADRDNQFSVSDVESAMSKILAKMNDSVEDLMATNQDIRAKGIASFNEHIAPQLGTPFDEKNPSHENLLKKVLGSLGCTASLSKIWRDKNGKDQLTIGNIGDSRTYILRNGRLEQISRDDSPLEILIDEGIRDTNGNIIKYEKDAQGNSVEIDINREVSFEVLAELSQKHPELRNLVSTLKGRKQTAATIKTIRSQMTQTIGGATLNKHLTGTEFKPFVRTLELQDGDIILTCSDGPSDNLTDIEIQAILNEHKENPLAAAHEIQKLSMARAISGDHLRAKADDMTALVTRYKKTTS